MGTRVVSTGHKCQLLVHDLLKCSVDIIRLCNRTILRSYDHEIIIHNLEALYTVAALHKFFFFCFRMNQYHIDFTIFCFLNRITGSYCRPL